MVQIQSRNNQTLVQIYPKPNRFLAKYLLRQFIIKIVSILIGFIRFTSVNSFYFDNNTGKSSESNFEIYSQRYLNFPFEQCMYASHALQFKT